jgi:putative redox protein
MTTITADLVSGTQVTLSNGRHTWRADEPPAAGGDDTGPTPYELLVGSLAACTLITMALYCRHKQIPLKAVTARRTNTAASMRGTARTVRTAPRGSSIR